MSDNRTPVAVNTRNNHSILVTGDQSQSPLPQQILMDRGDEEFKEESKQDDAVNPSPPPADQGNQLDSDSDNK